MEIDKKIEREGDVSLMYDYLKCPCCDNFFYDKLRAFLLKCGHNICNKCLEVNKSAYSCLICLSNYNEEELKCLPVNFLLDEMIQKLINNQIINKTSITNNDSYKFYCVNCKSLMFSSNFHSRLHPHHTIIDYISFKQSQFNFYKRLKDDFMSDYQRRITSLQNNMNSFTETLSSQLTNSLEQQLDILKQENADNLEALRIIDLISEEEYNKLRQFKQSFIESEEKTNLLLNQPSKGNLTEESKKDLEKLFKNVIDIEQIFNTKLNNIDVKLNEINNNLNDIEPNKFSEDLALEISNNLRGLVYSDTNRNRFNTVLSYFSKNVLYLFDTILTENSSIIFTKEGLKTIFTDDPSNSNLLDELLDLKDFTITTDEMDGIYITGGISSHNIYSNKTFLIKKAENEKLCIEAYPNMSKGRCGHIAIYYDFKLFVIGGDEESDDITSVEYYDIISGYWLQTHKIPYKFESKYSRIIVLNNTLYIMVGLRRLFSLELNLCDNHLVKDCKWIEHKLFYDNSYDLNLKNYAIIGNYYKRSTDSNMKFFIIGGEYLGNFNSIIFSINFEEKVYLKKETELIGLNLLFGNQSSNCFNKENDFSFILGEDKDNIISIFKVYENLDIEEVTVFNKIN